MTVNRPHERSPIRFESDLTKEVPLPPRKNDPVQPISPPWNPRLSECLSLYVGAWCIYRGVTNRNMESGLGGIALVLYATSMMRDSRRVARLEDSHKRKIAKLRESLDTQKKLSKSLTEAQASHESAQGQLQHHLTATETELRETQNYLTATEERLLKIQNYLRAIEKRLLETQEHLIKQQKETAHYQTHARELRLECENLKAQLSEIQARKEKEDQEKEQAQGTAKANNTTARLQSLVSSLFNRK